MLINLIKTFPGFTFIAKLSMPMSSTGASFSQSVRYKASPQQQIKPSRNNSDEPLDSPTLPFIS